MMRRTTIWVPIVATLLAAAPAYAASRDKRHAQCPPVRSGLITADAKAQVYTRPVHGEPEVFFACAYGSKHTYNLGTGPPNISSQGGSQNTHFTLDGAMLAYESFWFTSYPKPGALQCEQYVVVRDLRTGRMLHQVPTGTGSPLSLCFGPIATLVVKSDGAVAWIAESDKEPYEPPVLCEVYAVDDTGSRLLASSAEINPYSLALGGNTLYWTQGGKPMSATLN